MKTLTIITLALFAACAAPVAKADYCRPYVTHTCEVDRHTECRYGYDHCGRRYSYQVTIVTYRSYYSDGSSSTYSKTYRG